MFGRKPLRDYIKNPLVCFDDKLEALQKAASQEWTTCPTDEKEAMLTDLKNVQSDIFPLKIKNKQLNEKLYTLRVEFSKLKKQVNDNEIMREVECAHPLARLFYPIEPFNRSSANNMPISLLFLKAEIHKARCDKHDLVFDNTRLTNLIILLEKANKILNDKLNEQNNRVFEYKN